MRDNYGGVVNGYVTKVQQLATKVEQDQDVGDDELSKLIGAAHEHFIAWNQGSTEELLNAFRGQLKLMTASNADSQPKYRQVLLDAIKLLDEKINSLS